MTTPAALPAPPAAIAARGLSRAFGTLVAVDAVDLTVGAGAILGLLGPDGAGKSTVLRMLATVLRPTGGDADVLGASVLTGQDHIRPRLGYMPQHFCLYPDLTVDENVEFFATVRGIDRPERRRRRDDLLGRMGMAGVGRRRAGRLSGGMKQKLMLAVTLLTQPALLLLDEPTTGVDPVSRREFWSILRDLHDGGTTIVVATPYMDEAERCTDLAFLDAGRITRTGTPAEITAAVPGVLVEIAADSARDVVADARGRPHVVSAHVLGDLARVVWDGDPTPAVVATELGVPTGSVRAATMDMETAFTVLAERGDR
ncbi:ABC transporter ATP-binding protein [Propionicicella superfundia]|uniref:ABC transporter ATP-binding protein n=1 Tax=Propionicicella superfundia TaxID=348582 RepID=UPI00041C6DDC|nr:ABC transporter ATP-binding protein [Propionicicella superfundia]